jgi:fructosamine-3-kinase
MEELAARVAEVMGSGVSRVESLGAGATGRVYLVELTNGSRVVAKVATGASGEGLMIESRMLGVLAERSRLPVPRVFGATRELLVMEYRPGRSAFDAGAERHAGELLAALHANRSEDGRYGLDTDGAIGPLHQPNAWCGSWVKFWRERRVVHMTACAAREGRLDVAMIGRLERHAARLADLIPDDPAASLIHGDIWSGNVLSQSGRVTAFLDPAPYFAHHEVELAFITMFSTFGGEFFQRYAEAGGPVEREFWETRRHVYMIFPLLVHVRLFGGGYVGQLDATLGMLGH